MDSGYHLRPGEVRDLDSLNEIEIRAARLFADRGVPAEVLEQTTPRQEFEAALASGDLLVAADESDRAIGFAHCVELGGAYHLEELDVDPEHGRRGVGRALVERVCDMARRRGWEHVTLTSYADVPWNAPFYESLGFRVLARGELSPALHALRDHEAGEGLDPDRRVVMRKRVGWMPVVTRSVAGLWFLAVLALSTIASNRPLLLSGWVAMLPGRDKGGHFLLMGGLAATSVLAFCGRRAGESRIAVWKVFLAVVVVVLVEEGTQQWLPRRSFSWADLAWSLAGVACLGGAATAWRVRERDQDPPQR